MTFPYLRYICDLTPGTGHNNAARGYIHALRTIGLGPEKVEVIGGSSSHSWLSDMHDSDWLLRDYLRPQPLPPGVQPAQRPDDKISIVHLHPTLAPRFWTPINERYNIAVCAWETDRLPKKKVPGPDQKDVDLVDGLNRFDDVWVPTQLVARTFIESGVQADKVHVIPHALLPELLGVPANEREIKVGGMDPAFAEDGSDRLVFYYVGSWNARKNVDNLVRAYFATGWTKLTPVELRLHCIPPSRDPQVVMAHQEHAESTLKALIKSLPEPDGAPKLALSTMPKDYEWLLNLHRGGNCFVTASRGEGFGLPVLEALAMGNLVMASSAILEEFEEAAGDCEGDRGALVKVHCKKAPIIAMLDVAGYELDHEWWEPELVDLRNGFLAALDWFMEGYLPGQVSGLVRELYGPAMVGEMIRERLEVARGVVEASGW